MSDISLPPTHIFSKQQKRRRINDENANVAHVVEKTNEEAGNGKIIEKLTKLCDTLSERLSEREIALNGANQILSDTENPLSESSKTKTLNNIEESLPKQFDALQANLIKIINEKCKFARKKESKEPLSYAETTTSHLPLNKSSQKQSSVDNFRSIMMATRNAEIAEQKDRKERACNLIIHGREENKNNVSDASFVKKFMEELRGKYLIKSIKRIGKVDNKKKPIMLTFHTEQEKEKIMMNLRNLKGNDYFKGISVTDDYTVYERQIMNEFRKTANEKNDLEPDNSKFVWKMRGNPRNGLVLKRFVKVLESEF